MQQCSRSRLISLLMVPIAIAIETSAADARSWLEQPEILVEGWGPPFWMSRKVPRQSRNPAPRTTTSAPSEAELGRELERELNRRLPAADIAKPRSAEIATTGVAAAASAVEAAAAWADRRFRQSAAARTAALKTDREVERELQRELRRLPPAPAVSASLECAERLAKIAHYAPLPDRVGPGECLAIDLVRLDSVVMPDERKVALQPPPTLRCGMAEEVAQWIRTDVGPAAAELGAPLASVIDNESTDCRSRNNIQGAKLSEHARGNALDVTSIRLGNGGVFNLADRMVSKPFRERMRVAACARFTTVLGPGADPYHAEHIHLDLAERPHRHPMCQWDVRDREVAALEKHPPNAKLTPPPLPQRKPEALAAQSAAAKAQTRIGPKKRTAPIRRWAPSY